MNNLKNWALTWFVIVTILALTTVFVSAHYWTTSQTGNLEQTSNLGYWMWGWFGMWGWMMWNANLTSEDIEDMNKMHDLMHSDSDITVEDFNWLIEEQKKYMWFSQLENLYSNVDEFNIARSENSFWYWMMGGWHWMMRGFNNFRTR